MDWFLIALAAPFLWALVNMADKYLVTNYSGEKKSSGALVLFSSLIGIVAAALIGVFTTGTFAISALDKILLVITGILSICYIVLYLKALETEEISAVITWTLMIPVFGYLLSFLFLGETLAHKELLGSSIIFLGAVVLSIDFTHVGLLFKKRIALLMVGTCLMYATNGVIFKFVASADSFWVSSFWEYVGLAFGGIFIFLFFGSYRRDFVRNIRTSGGFIFFINVISEFSTIAGNLLTSYAILIAPIALVYMVGAFQPLIVFIFTGLSTKFWPKLVTEDFSRKALIPKLIALVVMLVGSAVLFL